MVKLFQETISFRRVAQTVESSFSLVESFFSLVESFFSLVESFFPQVERFFNQVESFLLFQKKVFNKGVKRESFIVCGKFSY